MSTIDYIDVRVLEEGTDEITVMMQVPFSGPVIRYTTDGSTPALSSRRYTDPVTLDMEGLSSITLNIAAQDIPTMELCQFGTYELP